QEPAAMPVGAPAAETGPDHGTGGTASTTASLLAAEDAEGFRARWTDIQTGFVDAPRRAVAGDGRSAIGIAVTTSPPTTSATPSSATVRSSNGSWQPDSEGSWIGRSAISARTRTSTGRLAVTAGQRAAFLRERGIACRKPCRHPT